jgi:hypothetical protein
LTPSLFERLIQGGYRFLEGPERLALAGDLEGLTSSAQLPAAASMAMLPRVANDPEPRVQARAGATALGLSAVVPASDRDAYAAWLKTRIGVSVPPAEQGSSVETYLQARH